MKPDFLWREFGQVWICESEIKITSEVVKVQVPLSSRSLRVTVAVDGKEGASVVGWLGECHA